MRLSLLAVLFVAACTNKGGGDGGMNHISGLTISEATVRLGAEGALVDIRGYNLAPGVTEVRVGGIFAPALPESSDELVVVRLPEAISQLPPSGPGEIVTVDVEVLSSDDVATAPVNVPLSSTR